MPLQMLTPVPPVSVGGHATIFVIVPMQVPLHAPISVPVPEPVLVPLLVFFLCRCLYSDVFLYQLMLLCLVKWCGFKPPNKTP